MKPKLPIVWTIVAEIVIPGLVVLALVAAIVFFRTTHEISLEPAVLTVISVLAVMLIAFAVYRLYILLRVLCKAPARPLLFGTNMSQITPNSQFVTSKRVRKLFRKMHVTFMRFDLTSNGPKNPLTSEEKKALKYMRAMRITPLAILHFSPPLHPPSQVEEEIDKCIAINKAAIIAMNKLFRHRVVYYEFGNEPNLGNYPVKDAATYTQYWNQVIHKLRPVARNGKFGGPTFSQASQNAVADFVHLANPKPDFISWHEYNIGEADSPDLVLERIGTEWRKHVEQTTKAIEANGDAVVPVIISEWFYDAVIKSPDLRATPDFLYTYTQDAFTQLSQIGVFAANQFKAQQKEPEFLLIDKDERLTPTGKMFERMYEQLSGDMPLLSSAPGLFESPPHPAPTLLLPIGSSVPTADGTPIAVSKKEDDRVEASGVGSDGVSHRLVFHAGILPAGATLSHVYPRATHMLTFYEKKSGEKNEQLVLRILFGLDPQRMMSTCGMSSQTRFLSFIMDFSQATAMRQALITGWKGPAWPGTPLAGIFHVDTRTFELDHIDEQDHYQDEMSHISYFEPVFASVAEGTRQKVIAIVQSFSLPGGAGAASPWLEERDRMQVEGPKRALIYLTVALGEVAKVMASRLLPLLPQALTDVVLSQVEVALFETISNQLVDGPALPEPPPVLPQPGSLCPPGDWPLPTFFSNDPGSTWPQDPTSNPPA